MGLLIHVKLSTGTPVESGLQYIASRVCVDCKDNVSPRKEKDVGIVCSGGFLLALAQETVTHLTVLHIKSKQCIVVATEDNIRNRLVVLPLSHCSQKQYLVGKKQAW